MANNVAAASWIHEDVEDETALNSDVDSSTMGSEKDKSARSKKSHHHHQQQLPQVVIIEDDEVIEKDEKISAGRKLTAAFSCRIRQEWIREFLAELIGTFVLISFGDASVAQVVLSDGEFGDFFSINWGWGMGVALAVLVAGGASGAHLNPAVTTALALIGKCPWTKVLHFVAAQYIGAFLGASVVYVTYYDGFDLYGRDNGTAGVFATYPQPHLSIGGGVVDQIVGTALLLICVLAITDPRNMQVPKHLVPLYVGFTVLNIGVCFGFNCGYAINPARDFAPRLFTAISGWGSEPFTMPTSAWWLVPILATHFGAIVGAFVYKFVIENHWPEDLEDEEIGKSEEVDMEMNRLPPPPVMSVIAVETEEDDEKKVKKHRKKKKHHHHDKEERKDKKL